MTRKKITKRNIKSVADQIEQSMLAASMPGFEVERDGFEVNGIVSITLRLFQKGWHFISMGALLSIAMHVNRFNDLYETVVIGVTTTEDNIPAVQVTLTGK